MYLVSNSFMTFPHRYDFLSKNHESLFEMSPLPRGLLNLRSQIMVISFVHGCKKKMA